MVFSKSCEYGLRAALYLALHQIEDYVPIRVISKDLHISPTFLTKILQTLSQHGLLRSFRGPNGGVSLARTSTEIRISDIVYAIDGPRSFDSCILGLTGCGDDAPCPLHAQWISIREQLLTLFETTTLSELGEDMREFNLRISDNNPD